MAQEHIASGNGAPSSTPEEVGHHYIDLVAKRHYVSVGTASSSDWQLQGSGALDGNFAGSGSPEGVVTANEGARYYDKLNRVDYVKTSGNGTNTGWE